MNIKAYMKSKTLFYKGLWKSETLFITTRRGRNTMQCFLLIFQLATCISTYCTHSKLGSAFWNRKRFIAVSVRASATCLGSCDRHLAMQRTIMDKVHGSLSAKQCSNNVLLTGSISSRGVFGVMYGALVWTTIRLSGRVPSLMALRNGSPYFSKIIKKIKLKRKATIITFIFISFSLILK